MGLSEGPKEDSGLESLTMEVIGKKSALIFSAEMIEDLLQHKTYLADQFIMLPPFSAELQTIGDRAIMLYYKDADGNFRELSFGRDDTAFPDVEPLIVKLVEIGFNIEHNKLRLFGIPAQEAKYLLRERKFHRDTYRK